MADRKRTTPSPVRERRRLPTPRQGLRYVIRAVREDTIEWSPEPVEEPALDEDFDEMPAIERAGEVSRYLASKWEYAVSPNGVLRAWFRLVIKATVVLGIPVLFLVPVLFYLFGSIAALSILVAACILVFVIVTVPVLAIVIVARGVSGALGRRRR